MREVVLDTETTGINPKDGHRIIEIGALELDHHLPTGKQFHIYINPEKEIDASAIAIHGLTTQFLSDKPVFKEIVDQFLEFIGDAPLVIHNAGFDMGFINAELEKIQRPILPMNRAVDTLAMARKKFPGAQANLDALCRRFEIDNSHRDLHGALIDADLLATVYIELLGGRQPGLSLTPDVQKEEFLVYENKGLADSNTTAGLDTKTIRPIRPHAPSPQEIAAHEKFLKKIKNAIWYQS